MVLSDFAIFFSMIYIIFNSKNSVFSLFFNLISTVFVAITSFYQSLWLNAFICTFINIPMLSVGIFSWTKKIEKQPNKVRINVLSKKNFTLVIFGYLVISVIMLFILRELGGNLYYLDSFYSAGTLIGTILCSYAFIDQFKIFIVSNVLGIILYSILCKDTMNNIPLLLMQILYLIGNIISYINWIKILKQKNINENNINSENSDINDITPEIR